MKAIFSVQTGGRASIPQAVRDELGIELGDKVVVDIIEIVKSPEKSDDMARVVKGQPIQF